MAKDETANVDLVEAIHETIRLSVLWASAVAKAVGISPADLFAVALLLETGSASAGELMEVTGLTSGATTAMIKRLESAGVVSRSRDTEDARRVVVRLVEPPAAVRFIRDVTAEELAAASSGLDRNSQRQAVRLFGRTSAALERIVERIRTSEKATTG